MKSSRGIYSLLGAVCCVSLMGCGSQSTSTQPVTVVEASFPPQQQIKLDNSLNHQKITYVIQLLDSADAAMKTKRLTTPVGESAWDYYRDVLAIMPSNEEAHKGLGAIVGHYLQWAASAQRKGNLESARVYLDRAQQVLPRDLRINKARRQLAAAPLSSKSVSAKPEVTMPEVTKPLAAKSLPAKPIVVSKDGFYVLDVASVKKQSPMMQLQLASIADQIYAQNSRVQILAPTDQMGRWIYQQLNSHREDFRVRANLKISKQAKIQLLN